MELLPAFVREKLPPLSAQKDEPDPMVYIKFFSPRSDWIWYVIEGSPQGDDFFFNGLVVGNFTEAGSFSLSELLDLSEGCGCMNAGVERDTSFQPTRLSEVEKLHQ